LTPLYIKLRGFKGIKSGLGKDEIELDLSKISGQLVVIKGRNGCGKSTLIDNLHPYRLMPSRGTSVGSFSYYSETEDNALKELIWSHDGEKYKSEIHISKSQKCFLYIEKNGDWEVYRNNDLVIDGKSTVYDKCIEHILGSPEMYFTAAFSCQGKRLISNYKNSEIKALMADLLDEEEILSLGMKAKSVWRAYRTTADQCASKIEKIQSKLVPSHESENLIRQITREIGDSKERLKMLDEYKEKKIVQIAITKEKAKASEKGIVEKDRMTKRIIDLESMIARAKERAKKDIENLMIFDRSVVSFLENTLRTEQEKLTQINSRVGRKSHVLMKISQIEDARESIKKLEDDLAEMEKNKKTYMSLKEGFNEAKKKAEHYKNKVSNAKERYARAVKTAGLVNDVPCTRTAYAKQCQFLADAIQEKENLDLHEKVIQEYEEHMNKHIREAKYLADSMAKTGFSEYTYDEYQSKLTSLRKELDDLNEYRQEIELIKVAESESKVTREKVKDLSLKLGFEKKKLEEKIEKANVQKMEIEESLENSVREYETEIKSIKAKMESIKESKDYLVIIAGMESELTTLKNSIQNEEDSIEAKKKKIIDLESQIRLAKELEEEAAKEQERMAELNVIAEKWYSVAMAFGNNGIIALLIDDAGPSISNIANRILSECYGPRFSLSIETQKKISSGQKRETFDVVVFDGDTGDKKSISDMSGGERIWISEALTRAIALYNKEQTGKNFGTLFTDETDGALDQERKMRFMEMKRKVLEIGGYEREICITHTPELWALADHVIDMEKL